jgi:hypothetical protein
VQIFSSRGFSKAGGFMKLGIIGLLKIRSRSLLLSLRKISSFKPENPPMVLIFIQEATCLHLAPDGEGRFAPEHLFRVLHP